MIKKSRFAIASWLLSVIFHVLITVIILTNYISVDLKSPEVTVSTTTDFNSINLSFFDELPAVYESSDSQLFADVKIFWQKDEWWELLQSEEHRPPEIADVFCMFDEVASLAAVESRTANETLADFFSDTHFDFVHHKFRRASHGAQPIAVEPALSSGQTARASSSIVGVNGDDLAIASAGKRYGAAITNGSGDNGNSNGMSIGNSKNNSKESVSATNRSSGAIESRACPPRPQKIARGEYPFDAQRAGIEGKVVLRVEVLASGKVGKIVIVESAGNASLDRAACKAVQQWLFFPAKVNDRAVVSLARVPYIFQLVK